MSQHKSLGSVADIGCDTIAVCDGPVGAWTGIDGVMYTDCERGEALVATDAQSLAEVFRAR